MTMLKIFFTLSLIFLLQLTCFANTSSPLFRGYIVNKTLIPMKLKIYEIDKDSYYLAERNFDDNSIVPVLNLKVTVENKEDYNLAFEDYKIFIPESTKLIGHISEIIPPKSFDRKGFYKVTFNKAICPSGQTIYLMSDIVSGELTKTYNPLHHLGKSTLSLLGGSLAGALFSYQLGGLGLIVATHGYSLAAGAGIGGLFATVGGFTSSGKSATIEPGNELTLTPLDEVSLEQLKQVTCLKDQVSQTADKSELSLEILKVKQKKDIMGDKILKITVKVINNSDEKYRLSNFYLKDSQGKEYSPTFVDLNDDMFIDFPPKLTKIAKLNFFVDYPKATHWLVLKNGTFSKELGSWKVID
ncbi:MAG: DUF4352 domain-containing protein [Candidatus Melainabacteria bacterium]|nr:DUF4352 domain-containing protein [Candidatus Melainabacteria bacterium]